MCFFSLFFFLFNLTLVISLFARFDYCFMLQHIDVCAKCIYVLTYMYVSVLCVVEVDQRGSPFHIDWTQIELNLNSRVCVSQTELCSDSFFKSFFRFADFLLHILVVFLAFPLFFPTVFLVHYKIQNEILEKNIAKEKTN